MARRKRLHKLLVAAAMARLDRDAQYEAHYPVRYRRMMGGMTLREALDIVAADCTLVEWRPKLKVWQSVTPNRVLTVAGERFVAFENAIAARGMHAIMKERANNE